MNIGCCCTLAGKIQSPFYQRDISFYCIQPWVFYLLSKVDIQAKLLLPFKVLLFLLNNFCLKFLCIEYRTVRELTCFAVCLHIISLIHVTLNYFKYPTKIRLCLQANQNHLLRDLLSFSAGWDINGNRSLVDSRHQLCYFS